MKKRCCVIILAALFSCQKEKTLRTANEEVDVYVAGFVAESDSAYLDDKPTYWKNGIPVQVNYDESRPDDPKSARLLSIAVSGNDVYAAGFQLRFSETRGIYQRGMFWKNGIPADPNSPSINIDFTFELSSLTVSNNDTYMVGWGVANNATYWKNGNRIDLSQNAPDYSEATSMAVSGNDVFVAGISFNRNFYNGGYNRIAKYWKNESPINLTDGSIDAIARSIAISGNDIYVAGIVHSGAEWAAVYWKNGSQVSLSDGLTDAEVYSIAVSGTDVYVAGSQREGELIQYSNGNQERKSVAKIWKNGEPLKLTDGSKWAEAKSVAISGNDVYVAGFEGGVAKYWKNGDPVILGDISKYSEAYSIFLALK